MNKVKSALALAGVVMAVGVFFSPLNADAGRFRGTGGGTGVYLIDTDGDGVGDTRPTPGTGVGANASAFVDADGDGVCDTYASGGVQLLDGSAAMSRRGRR